jgi:hypothetical protein
MLLTGLASEYLHVHQPGAEDVAFAVDHLGALGSVAPQMRTHVCNHAIGDQQSAGLVPAARRI